MLSCHSANSRQRLHMGLNVVWLNMQSSPLNKGIHSNTEKQDTTDIIYADLLNMFIDSKLKFHNNNTSNVHVREYLLWKAID